MGCYVASGGNLLCVILWGLVVIFYGFLGDEWR